MTSRTAATLLLGLGLLAAGCGQLGSGPDGCLSDKPELHLEARAARKLPAVQRRVLAFYYPWFGTPSGPSGQWRHWNPNLPRNGVPHTPASGLYDSKDPATVRRHVQQAKASGIDGFVASWWGPELFEDQALTVLLREAAAEGLSVSVLVETGLTCKELFNHLRFLQDRRTSNPAWLREDGRPVVFLYGRAVNSLGPGDLRSVLAEFDLFTMADTLSMDQAGPFDGVFVYNPVQDVPGYLGSLPRQIDRHHGEGRLLAATVVPGYDDTLIRQPGLRVDREGGGVYRRMWEAAGAADWVVITSWNEWQEGSEIEPSTEHGSAYLDLTRALGQAWRR